MSQSSKPSVYRPSFERLETRIVLASPVVGVGTGLVGNYFSDTELNQLVLTRNDPSINFQWGLGSPDPSVPGDQFSARWSGKVQAQYSETYTFYTTSDEGVSLWVNGQQLVDNWTDHTLAEDSGSITLNAGEVYDIRLEYYENAFDAQVKLSWSSPSTARQVIPTSQLYAEVGNVSGSWLDRDIGNPGVVGRVDAASGNYDITGGGTGLSGNSDQFQYLYQTLNGDGALVAQVMNLASAGNARAGVMVRDSLSDDASFAAMLLAPDGTASFQSRGATGASAAAPSASAAGAPYWVKLIRDGSFLKGYTSASGVDGTWVLSGTAYVAMDRTVNVGLAVMSGSSGSSSAATFANVSITATVPLGAGLDQVRDYTFGQVFVDMAKQGRAPQTPAFGPVIATDANGWPLVDFGQIFLGANVNQAHLYNGTYKLSFNGKATLGTWVTPGGQIRNQTYNAATNTTTADVILNAPESLDSWYLGLTFTNTQRDAASATNTGVSNIKLIRPGYDPNTAQVFQDLYLQHLSQFNVLRFMDFTQTNNNTVANWSDRITPGYARQTTTSGVAWEYVIQLANQAHKDVWINVPSRATDDYIAQLAALFKNNLAPDLGVYVEFSNEVWNSSFSQFTDNVNAATAEVNAGGSALNADGETNQFYWGWRRTARRLKEISDIFGGVFGAGSVNTRVRPVLSGQFANPDTLRQGLEFIDRTYGSPKNYFYAVAAAPYFGIGSIDDTRTNLTVDEIINAMSSSIDGTNALHYRFNSYASRYGLQNFNYEGGPDTFGPNNIAAKAAASNDPRMTDLVIKYLNGWYSQGGGQFEWFEAGPSNWNTQYGTWGLSSALDDLNSAKILGTTSVVEAPRTPLTGGIPVPATFDARARAGASQPYSDPYLKSAGKGAVFDYVVRAPVAGTYKLTFTGATTGSNEQLRINIDNVVRTITLANTGGATNWGNTDVGNVTLAEGINFIRITSVAETAGWNMQSITLAPAVAANQPPTIVNPAAPANGTVTGKTVSLSVLGADDAGESSLKYSWLAVGEAPTSVTFSANGTNAAKNTIATFTRAGTYTFQVTLSDGSSTVTSSCALTVNQTLTSITVTPTGTALANGETRQLAATAKDQFAIAMYPQPAFSWSVNGGGLGGTVSSTGLYTSPANGLGTDTVKAAIGAISGTATVITLPPRDPDNPANMLSGLDYGYFEGSWTTIPNFDAMTPIKSGVVSNFVFTPRNRTDNFGFNYSGYVFVPGTGTYTFYTNSDDGSKLYIGGTLIVNNDGLHSTQERSGTAILKTGWHALKVQYIDGIGNDALTVSFSGPGLSAKQAIPNANLQRVDKAPVLVTPPAATPNPVTATTAALSVLGSDEEGESKVAYTWSATALPSGAAAPTFSLNGTNAAKNTLATFSMAGSYTLQVALSDGTLTTTATLNVVVTQTLTSIVVSPTTVNVRQNRTQPFTASGFDQFGRVLTAQPAFNWSIAAGGGSIDAGGVYTAPSATGSATVTASSGAVSGNASVTIIVDQAPTIATPAAANPNPVTVTTTALSVLGGDDGGEANLTYTWAATTIPAGAAAPTFNINATNAAKNATATFTQAGAYGFTVTISDGFKTATSSVNVSLNQTVTSIIIAPAAANLAGGTSQQFSASASDQFGNAFTTPPAFLWQVTAGGTITQSGLFTAGNTSTSGTVSASAGNVSGTASVNVTQSPPTIATPPAASPNPVTAKTTNLSVLGASNFGESALTYTWSTTGTPPAAVTFSANGSNAAKNTLATFAAAGTYNFQVVISDGTASTTGTCSVVVNQTLASVTVTPSSASVANSGTKQFAATALDQFGLAMSPQPGITWSVTSSGTGGTVSGTGLYTAPATGSPTDTVIATASGISGTATVTVAQSGPLPSAFSGDADIGSPSLAGSYSFSGGVYTVKASGADIWGTSDQLHYVYKQVTGDTTFIARVIAVQNTNSRAKAGVMFRDSLAAGARQANLFLSPDNTATFQYRASTNSTSSSSSFVSAPAPYWLKLVRSGNTITGYKSVDAATWTQVGSASIAFSSTFYLGLSLCSHDNTRLNTSTFDNVSIAGVLSGTTLSSKPSAPATSATSAASVIDNNLNTFFQSGAGGAGSGAWVGLDFGSARHISEIRYAPRGGYAYRMIGGKFQASNTADFSDDVTDLYTITAAPATGKLTIRTVSAAGAAGRFRYVRYLAPAGSFGNIAEFRFLGF